MKTENFWPQTTSLIERLDELILDVYSLADRGVGNWTRETLEQAANAANAAMRLLNLAQSDCEGEEFTP